MRKSQGFTLIELMVTIAVLAIVAMIAAPSFGNMLTQQNLKKSTNELIGVLNQARAKAVVERRNIDVELLAVESTTLPENTDEQMNWMPYGSVHLLVSSPTSIRYGFHGGVVGATADTSFTLCAESGGKSQTVSVSKMGTIQQVVEGTC
ncbi:MULTISPECIES: GspH/FimT family pseudopilin [Acinetobacter]|uniref:GspH/FimT family pseudopilin n=1 Tax=Acinetobacter TaxID=469 RepID=UPI000CEC94A1|nr:MULTISPECIES: GspH/FimT family pseudopilin [Acinetobacter]